MKNRIIYLDNAATSWPKPKTVMLAIEKCLNEYCANPGRGAHEMSIKCAEEVFETREEIAELFHIEDSSRVIFTKNCTEALNLAIYGFLKKGDHVIISRLEHNAVMRPVFDLYKKGIIEVTQVGDANTGLITAPMMTSAIKRNTKLVVINHSSNVTGIIQDIALIGNLLKNFGIAFLVDTAQTAGIFDIDMHSMNIDMLAFAGHKSLFGPQGTGGLILSDKPELAIKPLLLGGTGTDSVSYFQPDSPPEAFESGTINTPGIIGLKEGIRFVKKFGLEFIQKQKRKHLQTILDGICDLKKIKILSEKNILNNSGVISFNVEGMAAEDVSYYLDKNYGIATRPGLHCAPSAHRLLNTLECGCVRVSPGMFTNNRDDETLIYALRILSKGEI